MPNEPSGEVTDRAGECKLVALREAARRGANPALNYELIGRAVHKGIIIGLLHDRNVPRRVISQAAPLQGRIIGSPINEAERNFARTAELLDFFDFLPGAFIADGKINPIDLEQ